MSAKTDKPSPVTNYLHGADNSETVDVSSEAPRYTLKSVRGLIRSNWDMNWQDFPLDVMESVQNQLRIIQVALDHPHGVDDLTTISSELTDIQARLAAACEIYESELEAHGPRGERAAVEEERRAKQAQRELGELTHTYVESVFGAERVREARKGSRS